MFTVTKKPKTPNTIWDAANKRPLCKFDKKGILETNDETLAERLKARGHTVTGEVDNVEPPVDSETPDSEDNGKDEGADSETPESDAGESKTDGEADAEKTTAKGRRSRK